MYQKVIIVGNLGKDPETRYTPAGKQVTTFSVATNRGDETIWFRVSSWDRLAETCAQYLAKGRKVLVEGRLTADAATGGPRVWGDPPRASFEVSAVNVQFLSGPADAAPVAVGVEPADEDDFPF